jgi:uncharacterized protein (TIRG00374 family)
MQNSNASSSRWLSAGGIVLSAVCLYFALRGTDLRGIGAAVAHARPNFIVVLIGAQVLYFGLKAVRWRMLLAPVRQTSTRPLVGPMMIGFMANNLLPAHLGELVRMYLGARELRVAHSQVLATLMLERVFDMLAILALFSISTFLVPNVPNALVAAGFASAAISVAVVIAAAVYVAAPEFVSRPARIVGRRLPARLRVTVVTQLELATDGLRAIADPRLLAGIVVTSIAQWWLMAMSIYVSLRAVGVIIPAAASFVVLTATVLGVMVPAAPGFFGTLELTFMLSLRPFSVGDQSAMAAAMIFHIVPYVGVVAVGMYYVRAMGGGVGEIRREATAAKAQVNVLETV